MDHTYKTGGDPNDRLPVPAGRPAAPAGYPITTAGRQPSHPAFDDPFATEYEGWDPAAVARALAAGPARGPADSWPSFDPSEDDALEYAGGDQAALPRHWSEDSRLDLGEAAAPPGVIGQRELTTLDALIRIRREIDMKLKGLRQSILGRLEYGVEVEPGRWNATRQVSNECRLNFGALESLCGEDFVRDLWQRLEVKTKVRLSLVPSR